MSTDITMQELELETAELLPARETLGVYCHRSSGPSSSVTQVGYGNVNQTGGGGLLGNVAIANGSFNNILSLGSGNIG
jgi:hypothetical protein